MSFVKLCTQVPVPDGLQDLADFLAIDENPLNGHRSWGNSPPSDVGDGFLRLALPVASFWGNGRTLRVKILEGSPKVREKIRQYASVWSQYANIKFSFVEDADAEIRVGVDASGQSWSRVGTGCLAVPLSQPTMNFGWLTDSTSDEEFSRVIAHEFGHALGCIHEHQSPAAGIPWNKAAVYSYYMRTQGWSQTQVDVNIFNLYNATTTQHSDFDPTSIMLYAVPATLTLNGYSTPWNTHLSETDKTFINEMYPSEKAETGTFSTTEVHTKPAKTAVQRQVFAQTYPSGPPELAVGLTSLDISPSTDVRVSAFADKITTRTADVHINTWDDTTLFSASATWLKAAADDPSIQVGQASTLDTGTLTSQTRTSIPVTFQQAYTAPPQVIVWLNGFDMGHEHNWRVAASASDITSDGFVLHLDSAGDTVLHSASAAWIAFPKPGEAAGTGVKVVGESFCTMDVRSWDRPTQVTKGQIRFPATPLNRTPRTVLVALSSLDMAMGHSLRVKVSIDDAAPGSGAGVAWRIETWGDDSILYSAGASYIALF
ncbi:hypothetical protein B0H63DRAFT_446138 [Podospora didyma]|uniref:Peptidase metallopeptidase domain-containing protein n=1 Tax=Podospora didyma TaxID=330526 RepID=A0AAE0U478_9PEZI|nr:hypothetical protein B0H63DRAFT_446138 [Podospora didyma]